VRELSNLGMVTPRAGVGTTVNSRTVNSRYTASISDPTELFAFTSQTKVKLLLEDKVRITGDWLKVLPHGQGQTWPRFISLRYAAGHAEPICYTETLVQPAYEGIRGRIHKPGQTVYKLIEELRGEKVNALKQEITCVALPKKIAELLHAKTGAPALRVLRYYLAADDSLLSVAINTYPQDRFRLATYWKLNWAA
jgi:GntR family transcriptional regulator